MTKQDKRNIWIGLTVVLVATIVCLGLGFWQKMENQISELTATIEKQAETISQLNEQITQLQNQPEYLFSEAVKLMDSQDYENAKSSFESIINQFPDTEYSQNAQDKVNEITSILEEQAAQAEAEQLAKEEAQKPPLELQKVWITFNSIGTPEARLRVKNVSDKTIDAFKVQFYCFDNFDSPVEHYLYDTNIFSAISQDTIEPGTVTGDNTYWTLYGYDTTTKAKARLGEVHFTDGTTWQPEEDQIVEISW